MISARIDRAARRAIAWLRQHNARVRFESDGTVSVTVDVTRRRVTLELAIAAIELHWATFEKKRLAAELAAIRRAATTAPTGPGGSDA